MFSSELRLQLSTEEVCMHHYSKATIPLAMGLALALSAGSAIAKKDDSELILPFLQDWPALKNTPP